MGGPFEDPHQKFVDQEAAAASEFESSWQKFESVIDKAANPSQLFVDAKKEVDGISTKYADWYVGNEKLYSQRGNEYQESIYVKARLARENIDDIQHRFEQRQSMKREFHSDELFYTKLDTDFENFSDDAEVGVFTNLDTIDDLKLTEGSLNLIPQLVGKLQKLADRYRGYEYDFDYEDVPQMDHEDMKKLSADMKNRYDDAKQKMDFLNTQADRMMKEYDSALASLKTNIDDRVKTEESKLDEYKNNSGRLQAEYAQQKQRDEKKISEDDLRAALAQYRDYVPYLKNFAGRIKQLSPYGSGEGAPEVAKES